MLDLIIEIFLDLLKGLLGFFIFATVVWMFYQAIFGENREE